MKFLTVLILLSAVALTFQQKNKNKSEEDDNEVSSKKKSSSVSGGGGGFRGSCSCRDMEAQMEHLELRLDRMIELWNDFVDKNRDPYNGNQPGGPGGVRRPPQGGIGGGRGPYFGGSGGRGDERDREIDPFYPRRPGQSGGVRPGGGNMRRDRYNDREDEGIRRGPSRSFHF